MYYPAIHSRLDYWQLSLVIINDNPVIGVGMGGFSSYHKVEVYPHNILLEFAAEGGVVGLLVLCSFLAVMFKSAYRFSNFAFYFILITVLKRIFQPKFSMDWIGVCWIEKG